MKQTLSTYQIADAIFAKGENGFSWEGAKALTDYLEDLEEDLGEEMECDPVAFRCEYSEWETALECAAEYGFKVESGSAEQENEALEWLQDRTTVIEFDSGIIVGEF